MTVSSYTLTYTLVGLALTERPWTLLDNSMAEFRWDAKDRAGRGFHAIDSAYLSDAANGFHWPRVNLSKATSRAREKQSGSA